jgi:hypothetical protein
VQDLQEGADRLLDALLVAALDGLAQADALADLLVAVAVLELVVECLGQVVGDEAVAVGQELAAVLRHLPAGQVAGEAVHDRQVELGRQRLEQVVLGGVDHLLDRQIDVADEAMLASAMTSTPREKRPLAMKSFMIWMVSGSLILIPPPRRRPPCPRSPPGRLAAGIVVEEGRLGRLAAADQGRVGRELAEEVGLAGAARAQLDEVEVGLDQRGQAGDEVQLDPRG